MQCQGPNLGHLLAKYILQPSALSPHIIILFRLHNNPESEAELVVTDSAGEKLDQGPCAVGGGSGFKFLDK